MRLSRKPAACLAGLLWLLSAVAAAALPSAPGGRQALPSAVTRAQVVCDYRGCFGFGPQQWYRRPTFPPPYLPPNNSGTYYRPRAAGVPTAPYYRMVPPPPARQQPPLASAPQPVYRSPAGGYNRHVAWCLNRYRSYDPSTNRYMTYRGVFAECVSPNN